MLTQRRLQAVFHYDPDTGYLTWRAAPNNRVPAGSRAGTVNQSGYRAVHFNYKLYLEHRLVWLYVHGYWPVHDLDHINYDTADNRLSNLREATRAQNLAHARTRSCNTSGARGVRKAADCDRYVAQISINGRTTHIGLFLTLEEAKAAYDARHRELYGAFSPASA